MPTRNTGEGDSRKFIDQLAAITTVDGLPELTARIPLGNLDSSGLPTASGSLGATNVLISGDNARAYVSLRTGGGIAVVDLLAMRQVDADTKKVGDNIIKLPPGASPFGMMFDRSGNYLLVGDYNNGAIYVIDIQPPSADSDPKTPTYNHVVRTFSLGSSLGLRGMALTPDGDQLVVARSDNFRGSIEIYDLADLNAASPHDWKALRTTQSFPSVNVDLKEPLGLKTMRGPGGDSYIVFTDRRNDTLGVGFLRKDGKTWKVYNNIPFTLPVNGVDSRFDSFEVNDAYDIAFTPDFSLAFVYSYNRLSFDEPTRDPTINPQYPAGSSVAIIAHPFQIGSRVAGATRMIPLAWGQGIGITPDGKTLFASYSNTHAVFAFDVDAIKAELDANSKNPNLAYFGIDDLINGHNVINLAGARTGVNGAFINGAIDLRADYAGYRVAGGEVFQPTSPNSPNRPIVVGGQPRGIASQNVFLRLVEPETITDPPQPTFKWELGETPVKSTLFISSFAPGEGLFPSDTAQDIQAKIIAAGYRINSNIDDDKLAELERILYPDQNRNRILARRFDAPTDGNTVEFKLPSDIVLTPGQTYYWGVEVEKDGKIVRQSGSFRVKPVTVTEGVPAVVLLTHDEIGLFDKGTTTDVSVIAEAIAKRTDGALFMYNPNFGQPGAAPFLWMPLGSILTPEEAFQQHVAIILVSDWREDSRVPDSGFAEAAADALFAALVELDSQVGNQLFHQPIQLIGEGRGASVNSEIAQRILTYKGDAIPDLQITTLDPHDFAQPTNDVKFQNVINIIQYLGVAAGALSLGSLAAPIALAEGGARSRNDPDNLGWLG